MPPPKDFDKTLVEKTDEVLYDRLVLPDDFLPKLTAFVHKAIPGAATLHRRKLHSLKRAQMSLVAKCSLWFWNPKILHKRDLSIY